MACEYSLDNGKTFITEEDFKNHLATEGLDNFVADKSIDLNRIISKEPQRYRHEDINAMNENLGLGERVKAETKTAEELDTEATEAIKKGVDYNQLINDALEGKGDSSDVNHVILSKYAEELDSRLKNATGEEFDTIGKDLKRVTDAIALNNSKAGSALQARQQYVIKDDSLANFFTQVLEANGVDKLTEAQKKEVIETQKELEARLNEQEAKTKELETEIQKLRAEQQIKKTARKDRTTQTKKIEDIRTERKKLLEDLKNEWKGTSGEVRQGSVISDKMIKLTIQIADTYIREGVVQLDVLVKNIHEDLKEFMGEDAISEKEIQNIFAGEYAKERKTEADLKMQLADIRKEAKLINELEKLQKGEVPVKESKKREQNARIKQLQEEIKDFKKEAGLNDEARLKRVKQRNEETQRKINAQIESGNFAQEKLTPIMQDQQIKKRFPELYKEVLDAQIATEEVRYKKAKIIYDAEQAKRSNIQKIIDTGKGVINTSKAVVAGIDDSILGVQASLAIMANPKAGAKAIAKHIQSAFSEKQFQREIQDFHNASDWHIIEGSKLRVLDPTSHRAGMREENFLGTNYLDQLKVTRPDGTKLNLSPTRPFERAFTSLGNNLAIDLFRKQARELEKQRKTFESHPEEYKDLAKVINNLIGRSNLPKGVDMAKGVLAPVIWSPRLIASSLNTLGLSDIGMPLLGQKGFYASLTKDQRDYAIKQTTKGIATGVILMATAKMGGADVDADPRSVTFGNVQFTPEGNSYNIFGRYTPYVRQVAMGLTGQRVIDGKVQTLGQTYGGPTKGSEALKFARGKVTPFAGVAIDWYTGKRYDNSDFSYQKAAIDNVTPMSVQGLEKGLEQEGAKTLLTRFPWEFAGIKVSNKRDFEKPKLSPEEQRKQLEDKAAKKRQANLEKFGK